MSTAPLVQQKLLPGRELRKPQKHKLAQKGRLAKVRKADR
jgi:hypothetical protein